MAARADSSAIIVNSFDMVLSFARAVDLLHPAVSEHHLRVAYASACIAEEIGLSDAEIQDVLVAGAMHDVAAACASDARPLLDEALESDPAGDIGNRIHEHGMDCARMLSGFAPFARAASIIRFHHVDWNHGEGRYFDGCRVPLESHIVRLADRLAVLSPEGHAALSRAKDIRTTISRLAGSHFQPSLVAAFEQVSAKEAFWLDLTSKHKEALLKQRFGGAALRLDEDSLHALARVFAAIVDYRSAFTATHSSGVARASELLAARAGLASSRVRLVGVAGYLHDLGKLSISPELLERPGRLTEDEMLLIRQHPYFTQQILDAVPGLEDVATWAALHHERLDGKGYPFRETNIPLEARIVAVADIFTALTEDRPYRQGMGMKECMAVLHKMAHDGAIDGLIVSLLDTGHDDIERLLDASAMAAERADLASSSAENFSGVIACGGAPAEFR